MSESPGTLIGTSNVMTQVRVRVAQRADVDAVPGLRDRLRTHAMRALEGSEAFIHDAIILGHRLRLFTNSHHLADFWRDNWTTEAEWSSLTGRPVPREPALTVYAMTGVATEPRASYVSTAHREAYLYNTSYYADLRATCMEALGRVPLPGDLFFCHAGAVDHGGRGLLLLYPVEVIHPTPVWGLMEFEEARFLADGWLAVDSSGAMHAIERRIYARASLVESYPAHAAAVMASKFENVHDIASGIVERDGAGAQSILEAALKSDPRSFLRALPPEKSRELILRLMASPDARVLIDPTSFFGKARVTPGPLATAAVFSLKAGDGEAVRSSEIEPFTCAGFDIHVNSVPGHPREVARLIALK